MGTTLKTFGIKYQRPFKLGNVDLLVDCRRLPNPHGVYPHKTGLDAEVIAWLDKSIANNPENKNEYDRLLERAWTAQSNVQHDPTIVFYCTGGKHRSVYVAERVAEEFRLAGNDVVVQHLDLKTTKGT